MMSPYRTRKRKRPSMEGQSSTVQSLKVAQIKYLHQTLKIKTRKQKKPTLSSYNKTSTS